MNDTTTYTRKQIEGAANALKIDPAIVEATVDPEAFMREMGTETGNMKLPPGCMIRLAPDEETRSAALERFTHEATVRLEGSPDLRRFTHYAAYAPVGSEVWTLVFERWFAATSVSSVENLHKATVLCKSIPRGHAMRTRAVQHLGELIVGLPQDDDSYCGIHEALEKLPNTGWGHSALFEFGIAYARKLFDAATTPGGCEEAYDLLVRLDDNVFHPLQEEALTKGIGLSTEPSWLKWAFENDNYQSGASRCAILKVLSLQKPFP